MHSLWQVILLFYKIAVFKKAPQDLPASGAVLYLAVGFALLVSLLRYHIVGTESYSMLRVLLEVLVPGVVLYLLLMYFRQSNRFGQTFAAICGSGSIIYALALPVLPGFYAAALSSTPHWSVVVIVLLDIWSVAVIAYIMKHALDVGIATGISLSIAIGLTAFLMVESITPSKTPKRADDLLSSYSVSESVVKTRNIIL